MTRIKFCGLTRPHDIALAGELGVYAVGFVFWRGSPRALDVVAAARLIASLPESVTPVGVFVRPTRDDVTRAAEVAGIRVAQIHGTGDTNQLASGKWHLWVAASIGVENGTSGMLVPEVPDNVTILLDAHDPEKHGGTGRTIDWGRAGQIAARRRVLLAGGLTPNNVGEAIRRVKPYGVDVSSGIEDRPGVKNPGAMRAFVENVRSADLQVCERVASSRSADL